MNEPLISVLIVNCNHEDTLGATIASVLDQTWKNLELVVVDDGSTDGSCAVVESFMDDPRVHLHRLPENEHICHATNVGLSLVRGDWLARIDSDDLWVPERLERQMEVMAQHPEFDICFSWARWIDEHDRDITGELADLSRLTSPTYTTQREWLRRFFYHGNCLLHSSVLMRMEVVRELGGFEPTYRQLHDFDYWVRVAKRRNILVIPERLIAMRRFMGADDQARNSSVESEANDTRTFNEFMDIRGHLFEDMPDEVFIDAFGEDFRNPAASTPEELACEKAFLLCTPQREWQVDVVPMGLRALKELLDRPETAAVLKDVYGFRVHDFYELATKHMYNDPILQGIRGSREWNLTNEAARLSRENDELKAEVARLAARVADLEGSTSWRVTRPLRALSRRVHGDGAGAASAAAPARMQVFVHAFLAANLGDDLFVRLLCARYPQVDFTVAATDDYRSRFADIPNLTVHPTGDFEALVRSSDAVVHIGGCCFVQHEDDFSAFLDVDRFLVENARQLFFAGGNFGPYTSPSYLEAYRDLFRRYAGITFRDQYSAGLFEGYPNVAYAPDMIFGYPTEVLPQRKQVLFSPILLVGRMGKRPLEQYTMAYQRFHVDAIRAFLHRGYNVVLASFCQGQGDENEIERLTDSLTVSELAHVRTVFYRDTPDEVLHAFAESECVVATRFHAMVLGYAHSCKVLPLVYDQKTQKVLDDLGNPPSLTLDALESTDAATVVDALIASEPLDASELIRTSQGHFQFIDRALCRPAE